jgi:hypothetical protein
MDEESVNPELVFFRCTPADLLNHPPLLSSLQNLETTFFLISLDRYPHALVTCASAVESAMKSYLKMKPEKVRNAKDLYEDVFNRLPALKLFDEIDLKKFRDTRNRIIHYGFTKSDNEEIIEILLKVGIPFLRNCYEKCFSLNLLDSLRFEIANQLEVAFKVYSRTKDIPGHSFLYCFSAFSHQVRWSMRESLLTSWEKSSVIYPGDSDAKIDHCDDNKRYLKRIFKYSFDFDCPICDFSSGFVCDIDTKNFEEDDIFFRQAVCTSCDFVVRKTQSYLIEILCEKQIITERPKILREFGISNS